MSVNPYSARVRELFSAPAHAGELQGARTAQDDDQDVRVRFSATAEGGTIKSLRFKAWGCPHVIAAAEAICGYLEGRPVADSLEFSASDLMENLPVPVEKTGRILGLEDAMRSLGQRCHDET